MLALRKTAARDGEVALRFTLPDGKKQVYIFEFKMVKGAEGDGSAIRQIKEKNYAALCWDRQHRGFLIGMAFSAEVRSFVGFEWEENTSQQKDSQRSLFGFLRTCVETQ